MSSSVFHISFRQSFLSFANDETRKWQKCQLSLFSIFPRLSSSQPNRQHVGDFNCANFHKFSHLHRGKLLGWFKFSANLFVTRTRFSSCVIEAKNIARNLLLLGQSPQPKSKQKRNDFKIKGKSKSAREDEKKNFFNFNFRGNEKVWKFLQRHCWCLFVLLACINKTIIRRRWVIREIYSLSFGDRREPK